MKNDPMKLKRRDCPVKMSLHPRGVDQLDLDWNIGPEHLKFSASAVFCKQFSLFVQAVYGLYCEEPCDTHKTITREVKQWWDVYPDDKSIEGNRTRVNTEFLWDEEGSLDYFRFSRIYPDHPGVYSARFETDPVNIEIWHDPKREGCIQAYTVEGRDLCYAVAKAVTSVLQEKGIHGYFRSTGDGDCCSGDSIDLEQFLFIKAYALDAMDVRALTASPSNNDWAESSSIDKEIELLLFEM